MQQLLKPNLSKVKLLFVVLPLLLLFSCATTPSNQQGDILFSLLPQDAQFYLCFPVQQNIDLAKTLVSSVMPEMSPKNTDKLLNRISTVYGSFSKDGFSAFVSGSFPKMALNFVLKEKNGWLKIKAKDIPVTEKYYVSKDTGFQLAFPTSSIAVFAENVKPALQSYANYNPENVLQSSASQFFLQQPKNSDKVSFYVKDLGSLLPSLIASNIQLSFPFADGFGFMVQEENNPNFYQLEAFISLTDVRALRPAIATLKIISRLLNLSFEIETFDQDVIRIYGMSISHEQISLLVNKIMEE